LGKLIPCRSSLLILVDIPYLVSFRRRRRARDAQTPDGGNGAGKRLFASAGFRRSAPSGDQQPLGALEHIQDSVYRNGGYTAMGGQGSHKTGHKPPHRVYEAAIGIRSAENAHAIVRTSANNWNACAGQTVTVTEGNQTTP
jgi:hypothetical protein